MFLSLKWLNLARQTWRCPYTTDSDTGQWRKGIGDSEAAKRTTQKKLEVSKLEREIRRMARTGKRNIVVAAGSEQKEFLLYSHHKSKW